MGKLSDTPDKIPPLFLTATMLFVHTLSIKVLLLGDTLVGLVIVKKNPREVNYK